VRRGQSGANYFDAIWYDVIQAKWIEFYVKILSPPPAKQSDHPTSRSSFEQELGYSVEKKSHSLMLFHILQG